MSIMNICLLDEMTSWVENKVRQRGFASPSEFFRQLVHEAKTRRETEMPQENLEALLLEGVESEGEIVTASWWAKLHSDINDELKIQGMAPVNGESGI